MKELIFQNNKGLWKRYLVEDDVESHSEAEEIGLDIGVPDLEQLDWEALKVELNNKLHASGLFTIEDLKRRESGITSIIIGIFKKPIINLYKE